MSSFAGYPPFTPFPLVSNFTDIAAIVCYIFAMFFCVAMQNNAQQCTCEYRKNAADIQK
jgi:hypothetical protein